MNRKHKVIKDWHKDLCDLLIMWVSYAHGRRLKIFTIRERIIQIIE